MRALVTGGLGFIGRAVARQLAGDGIVVMTLSRREATPDSRVPGVAHTACDLRDAARLGSVMTEFAPHLIFHLAGLPDGSDTYEHALDCVQTNMLGTLNVLEAMRCSGFGKLIFGDSTKSYGAVDRPYDEAMPLNPGSAYAISKVGAWHLCRMYERLHGVASVAIRPTIVYGPGQPFNLFSYVVGRVRAGAAEIPLLGGAQTRAPLFIDDVVSAYLAAADRVDDLRGEVVNVSGDEERTVAELAELVIEHMHADTRVVERLDALRPTDTGRSICDNSKARELLDWSPRTELASGLRQTIKYLAARAPG